MKLEIRNKTEDFDTYRANRVKSLFNPEKGDTFNIDVDLPIDDLDWGLGLVVGPSGSGKTSIGNMILGGGHLVDLYDGWSKDKPIVDDINPEGDFNAVTGSLAAVGLGDVPSWLRPFHALSNGQQFRAGLARVINSDQENVVIDEFTSVVDRQIAKIGALAFSKSWKRQKGRKCVLLSCHYDIVEWLQPDWVYDAGTGSFKKKTKSGSVQSLASTLGRSTRLTGGTLSRITI